LQGGLSIVIKLSSVVGGCVEKKLPLKFVCRGKSAQKDVENGDYQATTIESQSTKWDE